MDARHNKMNTLYPIIRRARRPLLPVDEPSKPCHAEVPPVIPPLPESPLAPSPVAVATVKTKSRSRN